MPDCEPCLAVGFFFGLCTAFPEHQICRLPRRLDRNEVPCQSSQSGDLAAFRNCALSRTVSPYLSPLLVRHFFYRSPLTDYCLLPTSPTSEAQPNIRPNS